MVADFIHKLPDYNTDARLGHRMIIDEIENWFQMRVLWPVDYILGQVDPKVTDWRYVVAFLRTSSRFKDRLPNWTVLYHKAFTYFWNNNISVKALRGMLIPPIEHPTRKNKMQSIETSKIERNIVKEMAHMKTLNTQVASIVAAGWRYTKTELVVALHEGIEGAKYVTINNQGDIIVVTDRGTAVLRRVVEPTEV